MEEMGVENVHEEGQEGTNNLVGCTHYGLLGLPVSRSSGRRLCSLGSTQQPARTLSMVPL